MKPTYIFGCQWMPNLKSFCIFSHGEFGSARALNNLVFIFTPRFIRMIVLWVRYKQTGIFPSNNIEEMYCCPPRQYQKYPSPKMKK
jgi:hypothetical protein